MAEASTLVPPFSSSTRLPLHMREFINIHRIIDAPSWSDDLSLTSTIIFAKSMPSQRLPLMELSENDAPSSNATTKRRVSGRAVRAPEKFVPDAPSSQTGNTGGKRKRGGGHVEDVENEEDEAEEESDEEDDDAAESSDEEEVRQVRKRTKTNRKPVAKKPKVNGTAPENSDAIATTVKLPSRQKKPKKVVLQDANAEGLYAAIFTSDESSDAVAAAWLAQYEADNTASMTDLVNCILKSAGCDMKVTEDDVNDPDNIPDKLNDLQDEYKGQNITDYPLISKAKSTHAFKVSLTDFFGSLIGNMHNTEVLYDDIALIENIQLWVTTMSSSFLRPFRHTATVVALAITTSLCTVAKQQTESTAKSLRILEGEKKAKGANKSRLATFQQNVDKGNERRELCENTIKDFFDTVFVHRYRDVDPKIRTECVEALGQWVIILPNIFLEGAYLRYLGWVLSDDSAPTRHEAVRQLEKILKNTEKITGIREFVERFRSRIVEMATKDVETSVRASAIDLLDLFREAGMLEPDDIDIIGKLIFDSEARVRKAVVGFFTENIKDLYESKIEELGGEDALEDIFNLGAEDPGTPRSEWITLKCLAEVILSYDSEDNEDPSQTQVTEESETLRASGMESRFFLAAQALFDKMPAISGWEVLAGYLLFDHSVRVDPKSKTADIQRSLRKSFKLDEKEEVVLLEILDASVKLNLVQSDEHERPKKKLSKADAKELQESIARRLVAIVPRLLSKFGANLATAAAVLRLEQELNLNVFQALRLDDTAYPALLHEIGVQFKRHSDQRVLNEASAALLHARQYEELEDTTEESMQALWDDTVEDVRNRFQASSKAAGFTARGDLSIKLLIEFTNATVRVSKLASIMSPVDQFESVRKGERSKSARAIMVPVDIFIEIVSRGVLTEADPDIDDVEDDLVAAAAQSVLFYFMWKARSLQELISKAETIADIDVDAIRERLDSFKAALFSVFSSRGGLDDLRLIATGVYLDVSVLFSTLSPTKKSRTRDAQAAAEADDGQYAYLHTLVQAIPPEIQEELTSIFLGAEKQYAKKAKKILEAPADDDEPEDIDSDSEDDDGEEFTDSERKAESLKAERKLCELSGKLVLAILAGVLDTSDFSKGKLRRRIQRNRTKLGPNFKEVAACLDEPKAKTVAKKNHKSKAQQAVTSVTAAAAKNPRKSGERVVEEDDDEDEEEDLLLSSDEEPLVEDVPIDADNDNDDDDVAADAVGNTDEDEIMGD